MFVNLALQTSEQNKAINRILRDRILTEKKCTQILLSKDEELRTCFYKSDFTATAR